MKKSVMFLVLISFLSCRNQTNNDKEKKLANNSIEREIQDNKSYFNNLDFVVSLMKTDEDDRPSKFKIRITRENKTSQDIVYSPGVWPAINDSINLTRIDYFNSDNEIKEGIENYHDFIVADFNFDNLKDFAILYDYGGNGGPIYSYFFQNKDGKFTEDEKFPLNKGFFPKIMDKTNKRLTIIRPQGCCKTNTTIFQLEDNKWKIVSSVLE
jgi:hypothetical protein